MTAVTVHSHRLPYCLPPQNMASLASFFLIFPRALRPHPQSGATRYHLFTASAEIETVLGGVLFQPLLAKTSVGSAISQAQTETRKLQFLNPSFKKPSLGVRSDEFERLAIGLFCFGAAAQPAEQVGLGGPA